MSILLLSNRGDTPSAFESYQAGVLLKAVFWNARSVAEAICNENDAEIVLWSGNDQGIPPAYAVIRTPSGYLVLLGGTAHINHWLAHLDGISPRTDPDSGVLWHGMWFQVWQAIRTEINQRIPELTGNQRIFCVGYSYGGGLATIAADEYGRRFGANRVGLLTFGGPRSHLIIPDIREPAWHWRICNAGDIVSDLPPTGTAWLLPTSLFGGGFLSNPLPWAHTGQRWELRANGDFLQTSAGLTNSSLNPGNWASAVQNHDFDEYLRRLQQKLTNNGQWGFVGNLPTQSGQINNIGQEQAPVGNVDRLQYSDLDTLNQVSGLTGIYRITANNWPTVVRRVQDSPGVSDGNFSNNRFTRSNYNYMWEISLLMEIGSDWGWSESHYLPSGNTVTQALDKGKALAQYRKRFFANIGSGGSGAAQKGEGNASLHSVRVQNTEDLRSADYHLYTGIQALNDTGYIDYWSAVGVNAVLQRATCANGSHCFTYLRGIPDAYIINGNTFSPNGTGATQFINKFNEYADHLVSAGFGGRVRSDSASVPFVTATFANNLWTITSPDHGLTVGTEVTFHKIIYPKRWMGKVCKIVAITDDTFTVSGLGRDDTFVAPGYYRTLSYEFSAYTSVQYALQCRYAKRNCGGPFTRRVGRSTRNADN